MTGRLRSILGGSRIKKKASSSKTPRASGNSHRASHSSSWSDSLPRTKSGTPGPPSADSKQQSPAEDDGARNAYSSDVRLPDAGLAHALATDLTLRDVPQAMRYASEHMFTPLPEQPSSWGLNSTRVADVLNFRRSLPRLTTMQHLHGLLRSPTAVERETAGLVRAGALRKAVILRRGGGSGHRAAGGVVECIVEGGELVGMVQGSRSLGEATKETFVRWLKANPAKLKVSAGDVGTEAGGDGGLALQPEQVDQLVRGGFLTTYHDFDIGNVSSGFARPEDIGTMLSLQSVSRAAAGSPGAVGGEGAIHSSGGSGGARAGGSRSRPGGGAGGDLSLAVPGQGAYLKLMSAALSHLTAGILDKSTYKEMPEALLRERWDGGVANDSRQHAGKKGRREFAGVLPGRTRKWREFYGLAFDWVLHEAVGAGLVEIFETGSVGRAVRLL